jgi:NAD(P)-dependent dehydrogenase (short-subunit alcohol dehydrogenase family)
MTPEQMEQLQKAVVKAFTKDDLRQLVQFKLGQDLDEIVKEGPFKAVVFELLRWAEREGQTRTLVEAVLGGMRERRWGRIVNVGSTSTVEPLPHLALSNVHRMATVGFLKTLDTEVAGEGITVNTVATGRFATDRLAANWGSWEEMERRAHEGVPAGRLGSPEDYGDLVAFLCSDRAGYLTGAVIPLDGGLLRSA